MLAFVLGACVLFLGCPAAFSALFLFSDFVALFGLGALVAELPFFAEFAESLSGVVAVEALGAGLLHFDFKAAFGVAQVHAGGASIDLLSAGAAGADEGFLQVGFLDAAGGHAPLEFFFFGGAHPEAGHGGFLFIDRLSLAQGRALMERFYSSFILFW